MKNACLILFALMCILGCNGDVAEEQQNVQGVQPTIEPDWFFLHNGARFGPLTKTQLQDEYQKGRLHPELKAWSELSSEWEPLKSVFPDLDQAGSIQAGVSWTQIFRELQRIPEADASDVRNQEVQTYLRAANKVLQSARNLNGMYGPLAEINEGKGFTKAAAARKLVRLLRYEIEDAVLKNDQSRALESMATLCTLSHQMYLILSPVRPSMLNNVSDADEYFEISNFLSLSAVAVSSAIILNPSNSSLEKELEENAMQNMTWTTSEIVSSYDQMNVSRDTAAAARMHLMRKLLTQ